MENNYNLPATTVCTRPLDEDYRAWTGKTKWWAFGLNTDAENFNMYLAELYPREKDLSTIPDHTVERHQRVWEAFCKLRDILLKIGGHTTCFVDPFEEDMSKILHRGQFWCGRSRMMRGNPCRCHQNAGDLWHENREQGVSICTGYALSEDGIWRQHSWLLHVYQTRTQTRQRIIETTEKRVAYFRFVMMQDECEQFWRSNCL